MHPDPAFRGTSGAANMAFAWSDPVVRAGLPALR